MTCNCYPDHDCIDWNSGGVCSKCRRSLSIEEQQQPDDVERFLNYLIADTDSNVVRFVSPESVREIVKRFIRWQRAGFYHGKQWQTFTKASDVPQWLVDALNGLIGLIQLLPDEERRPLIANHRYLDALTASHRIESGRDA